MHDKQDGDWVSSEKGNFGGSGLLRPHGRGDHMGGRLVYARRHLEGSSF